MWKFLLFPLYQIFCFFFWNILPDSDTSSGSLVNLYWQIDKLICNDVKHENFYQASDYGMHSLHNLWSYSMYLFF